MTRYGWKGAGMVLALTLALGGCHSLPIPVPDHVPLISCTVCTVDHDGTYTRTDSGGMLVYGLTISGIGGDEIEGRASWYLQPKDGGFPSRHLIELPDDMVPGRHYLVVRRVPVGTWSFNDLRWRTDKAHGHTPLMGGRALAVNVAAGTITYAGDLTITVTDNQSRLKVTGDAKTAKAALAAYPGLTAPLAVTPLHDMRGKPKSGHAAPGF